MINQGPSQQRNNETPLASEPQQAACGYCIFNIEGIGEKWHCIYCHLIIKEPIQLTECGHRCCRGCYESRVEMSRDGKMECPVSDCNLKFDKSAIMPDRAFKRELDALSVICYFKNDGMCEWTGLLKAYQQHLDQYHVQFPCNFCQEKFSSNQVLLDHQAKSCPSLFETCPLSPHCTEQKILKADFSKHLLTEKHQEAIALILNGDYDEPEISNQDQSMELSSDNSELEQKVSEKLTDLAEKVQKLNDDTFNLSREFIKLNEHCQVAVQEVNRFQIATIQRNLEMSDLQPKQDEIQKRIEQIKQNIEDNQHLSTDGTLTWRIDRVAERMADAQSEREPSIYSPIFYSAPAGYKMRGRLYLHGDGNAKRTHMSLFFLLMKGDFDALLSWPFGYKVTFCLFDQTGNNRHIIDSFRPDIKSNSFQRPKNETNIASGIPKFFPLPMIQQDDNPYVRDDTMFLKIIVDLNETPKIILPFMLTLNPGLPHHVQQNLINQEKAKRDQQGNTLNTGVSASPSSTNTCG